MRVGVCSDADGDEGASADGQPRVAAWTATHANSERTSRTRRSYHGWGLTGQALSVSNRPMLAVGAAMFVAPLVVSLPPPLCRGRVVTPQYDPRQDKEPTTRAWEEVKAAYAALCPTKDCGRGKVFRNDTIGNNAVTWVSGIRHGKKTRAKIVYGPTFLNRLNAKYGPGASFGVLAHEVGHHLTAALSLRMPGEPSWNEELRADYLAGCALGRAGRASDELENALRALASVATASHPSFRQRNPVVRRGFRSVAARRAILLGHEMCSAWEACGSGTSRRAAAGATGID